MKKTSLILLLFVATLNINSLFSQEYYRVNSDNLNVRLEASPSGLVVQKLSRGDTLIVQAVQGEWASITINNEDNLSSTVGFVKLEFIEKVDLEGSVHSSTEDPGSENQLGWIIFWSFLGICFICYIIAMIKVRNGTIVAIANWYDFTLLVLPFVSIVVAFIATTVGDKDSTSTFAIIVLLIGGLGFLGSLVYSVVANWGKPFNIVVSIFAKMFVLIILWVVILYIFRGKKKDTDIIEDIAHGAKSAAAVGIAGFLIFRLIGDGQHQEIVEKMQRKVQ